MVRKGSLRIYLAGSFDDARMVQSIADLLQQRGHIITVDWWGEDAKTEEGLKDLSDEEWYMQSKVRGFYLRDLKGIDDCDAFIIISPTKRKYNGANVELGYAIAKGKIVMALGELERCAMYWGVRQCNSTAYLIQYLEVDSHVSPPQPPKVK